MSSPEEYSPTLDTSLHDRTRAYVSRFVLNSPYDEGLSAAETFLLAGALATHAPDRLHAVTVRGDDLTDYVQITSLIQGRNKIDAIQIFAGSLCASLPKIAREANDLELVAVHLAEAQQLQQILGPNSIVTEGDCIEDFRIDTLPALNYAGEELVPTGVDEIFYRTRDEYLL